MKTNFSEFIKNVPVSSLMMKIYYLECEIRKRLTEILEKEDGEYTFKNPIDTYHLSFNRKTFSHPQIIKVFNRKLGSDSIPAVLDSEGKEHIILSEYKLGLDVLEGYEREQIDTNPINKKFKTLKFENQDILITDPCYIINKPGPNAFPKYPNYKDFGLLDEDMHFKTDSEEYKNKLSLHQKYQEALKNYHEMKKEFDERYDDWSNCNYGQEMEKLGIKNYMTEDTLYGDWGCTTFDTDTKKAIGEFCADAGLVSVFDLDEVRQYNPGIDKWISEHSWCATVIKNFTGKVSMKVIKHEGIYEEDSKYTNSNGEPYHKKGEHWEDYELRVFGNGSINFETSQTSL